MLFILAGSPEGRPSTLVFEAELQCLSDCNFKALAVVQERKQFHTDEQTALSWGDRKVPQR